MREVELAAGTIEYDEVGSGPPVVLLHGLLMDHTLWDGVLGLLPERIPVRAAAIAVRGAPALDESGC